MSEFIQIKKADLELLQRDKTFWGKIKSFFSKSQIEIVVSEPQNLKGIDTSTDQGDILRDGITQTSSWDTETAIREGYKASTFLSACISKVASSIASVSWNVQVRKNGSGDWIEQPNHPLKKLIDKPNEHQTRIDFFKTMVMFLFLGGNSLTEKVYVDGKPRELWMLGPQWVSFTADQGGLFIESYKYMAKIGAITGNEIFKSYKDIIHIKIVDPANALWGMPIIQAGAKSIDSEREASEWEQKSFANRCITDGIISFQNAMSVDQYNEARAMVAEQHQGAVNSRAPWVLGNDVKFLQMSLSPAEMDFIQSKKLLWTEICAICGTPPPLVGILESSTYNNIKTARQIFWEDTILVFLDKIQDDLNLQLTPDFDPTGNTRLIYDPTGTPAFIEIFSDKIKIAKDLWSMGVPFNQIITVLSLSMDPIPNGDIGLVAGNLIPTGTNSSEGVM